jgi:glycosyltransferase involved in cell wall biosynthesis
LTAAGRGKVLFVSHDASRTGATILLLSFLRWFKSVSDVPFEVMLRKGGELEGEFAAIAPVCLLHPETAARRPLAWRVARKLGLGGAFAAIHRAGVRRRLSRRGFRVIYSSTLTNGEVLELLGGAGCAVVTHVHELESWIRRAGAENLAQVKRHTTKYVAGSHAVKANLVENHGVAPAHVDVIHDFITVENPHAVSRRTRAEIRADLGIPPDAVVVGAMGTTDWRKGADLFVQLAVLVRKSAAGASVRFVWVGGDGPNGPRHLELLQDVTTAGLAGYLHLVLPQTNPRDWFETFDVFTLTSREDPFPLVCLDAAALGRPVLCFDGAGGEKEFVEEDCGFVVPYIDVAAMAAKVVALAESPELRARLGAAASRKVRERHDISVAGPQLLAVIDGLRRG